MNFFMICLKILSVIRFSKETFADASFFSPTKIVSSMKKRIGRRNKTRNWASFSLKFFFKGSMSSFSTLSEHLDSSASLAKGTSAEWIHVDHNDGIFIYFDNKFIYYDVFFNSEKTCPVQTVDSNGSSKKAEWLFPAFNRP